MSPRGISSPSRCPARSCPRGTTHGRAARPRRLRTDAGGSGRPMRVRQRYRRRYIAVGAALAALVLLIAWALFEIVEENRRIQAELRDDVSQAVLEARLATFNLMHSLM